MKEIISTDKAPKAIGPYSQATRARGFLFTAGQIALDPATGQIVEGDVARQTSARDGKSESDRRGGRIVVRSRGEDHGLFEGHGRFRGDE